MIPIGASIIGFMLVFTRVSTCLMILPGFSSVQVPINVRLFIALGVAVAVFSLAKIPFNYSVPIRPEQIFKLMAGEFLIAAALAIPIRFFFLALSFLGEVITHLIGLNPIPGTPIADNQSSTVLSGLFNVTATVLFFSTGLHFSFIMALAMSFELYPPGEVLSISLILSNTVENLGQFFNIVLRLGSPIVIYAVIANLIAGLVNKLTPQIPVYFVSAPFLICGGIVLLTWMGDDLLMNFHLEVSNYMNRVL